MTPDTSLSSSSQHVDTMVHPQGDPVASHVFDQRKIQGSDFRYYLNAEVEPDVDVVAGALAGAQLVQPLGDYELALASKVLYPVEPITVILGPMGSGKTTSIKYVTSCIKASGDGDGTSMFLSWINCYTYTEKDPSFKSLKDTVSYCEELCERIVKDVIRDLRNRLRGCLSSHDEFVEFWERVVAEYLRAEDRYTMIGREIEDIVGASSRSSDDEKVTLRSEWFARFLASGSQSWHLRYLLLLWTDVVAFKRWNQAQRPCVIIDNLDSLPPHSQQLLVRVIQRNVYSGGVSFVVLARPETALASGIGDDTVDRFPHAGPGVVNVVAHRLRDFLDDPDTVLDKCSLTGSESRSRFIDQARLAYDELTGSQSPSYFREFLSKASGRSIRSGLIIAQGVFMIERGMIGSPRLKGNSLVGYCIRRGRNHFVPHPKDPVENLFQMSSYNPADEPHLVKLRVLRYVKLVCRTTSASGCKLNQLVSSMSYFGYQADTIFHAVGSLIRVECQLLRTDAFDARSQHDPLDGAPESVFLTRRGEAYLESLGHSLLYVEEMIASTTDSFMSRMDIAGLHSASARLAVVHDFLRFLNRVDREEVISFVRRCGTAKYARIQGEGMVTRRMISDLSAAAQAILRSIVHHRDHTDKRLIDDGIEKFVALEKYAATEERRILGGVARL